MRRPAKVVRWQEKRHDDSGEECEPARHLWSPCLSLCKPRACRQTKKETHCCGISPTRAGKKEKVRTAIESAKEEAESKSQVPASSRFENGCRGPKKGVGDPALFYCRISDTEKLYLLERFCLNKNQGDGQSLVPPSPLVAKSQRLKSEP